IQGAHAVTGKFAVNHLRERGIKAGVVRPMWTRPFPTEEVKRALGRAKVVGVVETNLGLGGASSGGALMLDVCTALYPLEPRPLVTSFMAGLGGETVPLEEFYWMARQLESVKRAGKIEEVTHWGNFED